jgi:hypothetical protein
MARDGRAFTSFSAVNIQKTRAGFRMMLLVHAVQNVVLKPTATVLLVTSFLCGAVCQSRGSSTVVIAMPASLSFFFLQTVSCHTAFSPQRLALVPYGAVVLFVPPSVVLKRNCS